MYLVRYLILVTVRTVGLGRLTGRFRVGVVCGVVCVTGGGVALDVV